MHLTFNKIIKTPYFFLVSAFIAGLLLPFAYAPYDQFWMLFPLLGWLFFLVHKQTAGRASMLGWLFGMGWFFHGTHWIYYSLHYHGGTPLWLVIIILALLSAYLAIFPALAMYGAQKLFAASTRVVKIMFVLPALWMLSEWLRGWLFTGFPWLQIGYTQIDTPLAGYAPLVGGLGVSYVAALTAALLVMLFIQSKRLPVLFTLLAIWLGGWLLMQIEWVEKNGNTLRVSLIQGNVPQQEKWEYGMREMTMERYRRLTELSWQSDLIVWPETAVPDYLHRVPDYINNLRLRAEQENSEVLFGIFTGNREQRLYYNSVVSLRDGIYRKRHLVPLGEYFPFRTVMDFFRRWINIPMSDIASAGFDQELVTVAGHKVGINICFEDAFDRDVIRDVPEAALLVNVSNDAWFEDSIEPWQHHQIARMRALEAGRYLLRSTNTGVSSVIDHKGRVVAQSPQFQTHVLNADVQPLQGRTPYALWRNYLLMVLVLGALVLVFRKFNKSR
ncbi:MAG: apolipoprotein N-acyltransferase [Gammaproteobacteria bacterium]|nr:apolipoprotein N-acyltransferase [Gammaproteobacteria bacterium]